METNLLVQQILEGASPRDVIGAAATEQTPTGEAATVTKKVVRNGKVVKKKFKKYKKKRILTAAQKRAIKKAQQAAKRGTAVAKRRKSLKKAATLEGEETFVDAGILCPNCGKADVQLSADLEKESTIFYCPNCDSEYSLVSNDVLADLIPDEDEDDNSDVNIDIADGEEVIDIEDGDDEEEDDESAYYEEEQLYFED